MEITDCCDGSWLSGGVCRKHVVEENKKKHITPLPRLPHSSLGLLIHLLALFFFFSPSLLSPPSLTTGVAKALGGLALKNSQYVYLPLPSATHRWQEETFTSLHIAHRELNSMEPLRNHICLCPSAPPDWSAANNPWKRAACVAINAGSRRYEMLDVTTRGDIKCTENREPRRKKAEDLATAPSLLLLLSLKREEPLRSSLSTAADSHESALHVTLLPTQAAKKEKGKRSRTEEETALGKGVENI